MAIQTYTIEYVVEGALDGTTLAPAVDLPIPTASNLGSNARLGAGNIIQVPVTGDLGVIDLTSGGLSGGSAPVYINQIFIDAAAPGDVGAQISVADARGGVPSLGIVNLEIIGGLEGVEQAYSTRCVYVPQGAALRISGFDDATAMNPHRVRVTVVRLDTQEADADLAAACCCNQENSAPGFDCLPSEEPLQIVLTGQPLPTIAQAAFLTAQADDVAYVDSDDIGHGAILGVIPVAGVGYNVLFGTNFPQGPITQFATISIGRPTGECIVQIRVIRVPA